MTGTAPGLPSVSRETRTRLDVIVAELLRWQARINLVSPATIADVERRHVADSLQLHPLAPDATRWLDLGSGGGFPGLVVAAELADTPGSEVVLVESNAKKCAFLRETSRRAGLPVEVICGRIEEVLPGIGRGFDVVSARALAPLETLFSLAEPVLARGALGLFPKGADVDDEIRQAERAWIFERDLIQSVTEPKARIVRVRSAIRRNPA